MAIYDGWMVLIGTHNGEAFIAAAASTNGRLTVNTSLKEKAGASQGAAREYEPDMLEWHMSVECFLKKSGNGPHKGDRARWALKLPGEVISGEGVVVNVDESGGVTGKGTINAEIRGTGNLTVVTATENE